MGAEDKDFGTISSKENSIEKVYKGIFIMKKFGELDIR